MNNREITSLDNALVKRARSVRDGKLRDQIFIEGVRLCEEVLRASLAIEEILFTEKLAASERGARLLTDLRSVCTRITRLRENVFKSIADTKTPPGIVLLAARPQTERSAFALRSGENPLIVVLHQINNPSNAGAILRTAEAAGATGAIATEGATDLFSPKALRGAMGSAFRIPLWTGATLAQVLAWCAEHGVRTVSASTRATLLHTEIDWTGPRALILGAEASGLDAGETKMAGEALKIPMRAPVESLNVSVASAIALYEAARQRAESQQDKNLKFEI